MRHNAVELERVFKISLYGLAMFAGLVLGLAEENWLPYLTIFLALVGYWLTESQSQFSLGNWFSNLAGLIAVGMAGMEFFGPNPEGRLLAGTHLVVYATWIVFLQRGSLRKYWSICALSVLQVAVASVLTNDSWYGGALVAFAMAAMWTLAVFSLYHAVDQQAESASPEHASPKGPLQWTQARSDAGRSIQFDGAARWITPRFVSGIAVLSLLALVMSAAFYILTPRVWIGSRLSFGDMTEEPELGRRNLTGFTQQVKLGELGQILESLEPVMMIHAFDVRSGEDRRLSVEELANALGYDEPLFRGGILTSYAEGSWQSDNFTDFPERLPRTPPHTDLRQEITLEPVAGDILFGFGTPVACDIVNDRQRATCSPLSGVLRCGRQALETRKTLSYRLYTEVPTLAGDGLPRFDMRSSVPRGGRDRVLESYLNRCRDLPEASLPRLVELSRSLAKQETDLRGRQPTTAEMARRLESYFRDSGEYQYTVNLTIQDASIDPVEDFLINRKTGHCEYFATALALMLRSVGIPSRLMNGFKGGEVNYRGQIEVQQRHAHAWVEAWEGNGRWIVLDPTPAGARAESVKEVAASVSYGAKLQAFFASFWTDWVMNFTPDRQRDDIFLPLKDFGQKLLVQAEEVLERSPLGLAALWNFLTNPREWFSLKGLQFAAILGILIYGGRLAYLGIRRWWRWTRYRGSVLADLQETVPFYERLLALLTARGFLRLPDQTPAEFAQDVAHRIQNPAGTDDLEQVPGFVTEQFYRVRFGELELSAAEMTAITSALDRLESPRK